MGAIKIFDQITYSRNRKIVGLGEAGKQVWAIEKRPHEVEFKGGERQTGRSPMLANRVSLGERGTGRGNTLKSTTAGEGRWGGHS